MKKIVNLCNKILKDWKLFELLYLFLGITITITVSIILKSDYLSIFCAVISITCTILYAKGKIAANFLCLFSTALYAYISFREGIYGETIICAGIIFPVTVYAIISWLKNKNEDNNTVKINTIGKVEWIIIAAMIVILGFSFFFILRAFNTNQLVVSSISMTISVMSFYILSRRSKFAFLSYILYDIIQIVLWSLLAVYGDIGLIVLVVSSSAAFVSDCYGWINWNKTQKAEKKQHSNSTIANEI